MRLQTYILYNRLGPVYIRIYSAHPFSTGARGFVNPRMCGAYSFSPGGSRMG